LLERNIIIKFDIKLKTIKFIVVITKGTINVAITMMIISGVHCCCPVNAVYSKNFTDH